LQRYWLVGVVDGAIRYWVATTYIVSQHAGDPLQTQGGLKPSQEAGRK
jgi:hypothetical protein